MRVFIMGLTASGKSFQARAVGAHFELPYVSGSAVLLSRMHRTDSDSGHIWLGRSGGTLNALRDAESYDRDADLELLDCIAHFHDCVVDSWTMPWLFRSGSSMRIYLNASLNARSHLAHGSKADKAYDVADLARMIKAKDDGSRRRFLALYGFDIYDHTGFDLVLDNSELESSETTKILTDFIRNSWTQRSG